MDIREQAARANALRRASEATRAPTTIRGQQAAPAEYVPQRLNAGSVQLEGGELGGVPDETAPADPTTVTNCRTLGVDMTQGSPYMLCRQAQIMRESE